jgi:cupin 2 domain-containing protein
MIKTGNLFANVPAHLPDEEITTLAELPGVRIERIVSTGQASPPDFWCDQDHTEWVVLLSGSAGLLFEGEDAPRVLRPGDYVEIPPHVRHRSNGRTPANRRHGWPCMRADNEDASLGWSGAEDAERAASMAPAAGPEATHNVMRLADRRPQGRGGEGRR